jgi:YegS/Rv2252/BmrU family lipid kinase
MPACPFKTKFIVNPQASSGKVGWEWGRAREALERIVGKVDAEFTTGPAIGTILTRRAIEEKYELIVAVGGDGTVNDVANGFLEHEAQVNPEAILGVLALGNGSDFVRSLGYPPEWDKAIQKLTDTNTAIMDLGRFRCQGGRGEEIDRYFVNIADCGLGGETVASVKGQSSLFGGKIQFFLGAAKALMKFKNKRISFSIDDEPMHEQLVSSLVVANGQFFGAGMWIAPHAKLDDGKLDVLVIDKMEAMEAYKKMQAFQAGTHVQDPAVKYRQASKVAADSAEPIIVYVDGEPLGRLPCSFVAIQHAIRVKV